jgi:hypothetical protein
VKKRITIRSDDREEPALKLTVHAKLTVAVGLERRHLDFGSVGWKEEATRTVALIGREVGKVQIESIDVEANQTQAPVFEKMHAEIVDERDAEDGQLSLRLTLAPGAPVGRFQGVWKIKLDNPTVPELKLRVMGKVRGPVDVMPDRLFFANVDDGTAMERSVSVYAAPDQPAVKVLKVECDHPAVFAAIEATEDGKTRIKVTCSGNLENRREQGKLKIFTDQKELPEIEIPVVMMKRRKPRPPAEGAPQIDHPSAPAAPEHPAAGDPPAPRTDH